MAKKVFLVDADSLFEGGRRRWRDDDRDHDGTIQDRLLKFLIKERREEKKKKEEEIKKKNEPPKPRTFTFLEVFGMLCFMLVPTGIIGSYALLLWLSHIKELMNTIMK